MRRANSMENVSCISYLIHSKVISLKITYVSREEKNVVRHAVLKQMEVRVQRTSAWWERCSLPTAHIGKYRGSSGSKWNKRSYLFVLMPDSQFLCQWVLKSHILFSGYTTAVGSSAEMRWGSRVLSFVHTICTGRDHYVYGQVGVHKL